MTRWRSLLRYSSLLSALSAAAACSSEESAGLVSLGGSGSVVLEIPGGATSQLGEGGTNASVSDPAEESGAGTAGKSPGSAGRNDGTGGSSSAASGGTSSAPASGTGTACDNGLDDDGDGLVDGFDAECTGPFDDDEGTFATGIPGDNRDPKWQDCFFDGNSGAGDDGCRYHTDCLYGKRPADDKSCTVSDACLKYCAPLTPNGCDCFGCCTVTLPSGGSVDVVESGTCSLSNIADPEACPRCTKNTACGNECGECELCPGKTELPESCAPPSRPPATGGGGGGSGGSSGGEGGAPNPPDPVYTCDNGEPVCGPDRPCPLEAQYCSQGCCIIAIR